MSTPNQGFVAYNEGLGQAALGMIKPSATGMVVVIGNSSNPLDFSNGGLNPLPNVALGAAWFSVQDHGAAVPIGAYTSIAGAYAGMSGSLSPAGTRYVIGGGGGATLEMVNSNVLTAANGVVFGLTGSDASNPAVYVLLPQNYTGGTSINATMDLLVGSLANGGQPSSIGQSSNAAGNLVFSSSGGLLQYVGTVAPRPIVCSPSSPATSLDSSGGGPLVFTNTGQIALLAPDTSYDLTLQGSNAGLNTFGPRLVNSTSVTSLFKFGPGTWVLANTNNIYTGVTTVNGGVLLATGSGALGLGGQTVFVDGWRRRGRHRVGSPGGDRTA